MLVDTLSLVLGAVTMALLANTVVAVFIFLYWQIRVQFVLTRKVTILKPGEAPGNLRRFFNGEIRPDLRQKWMGAFAYVLMSCLALMVSTALWAITSPDLIR